MSFQAVRLKPFLSTTYHVKVAGLRAKLSWTTVVYVTIFIHGSTPVRRRA